MRPSFRRLLLAVVPFTFSVADLAAQERSESQRYAVVKDRVDFQVNSKRVGSIREGTVVTVDGINGDWLWVGSKQAYLAKSDAVPFETAVEQYTQKIEAQKSPANYFQRAKLYRSAGELAKAVADVEAAIKLKPADIELILYKGTIQIDQREFDAAIATFNVAYAQLEVGKKETTLPDYHLSKDTNINVNARVLILNNRGWAASEKKQYDQAIGDFNRAALIDPNYARVILNRAITQERKGDADKAIADYTEVIRLVPDFAKAYNNRGRVRFAKGKVAEAIADYTQAIQIDPSFNLAYINRRIAWESKGDWESLSKELTAMMKSNAPTVDAINAMAWLMATCPEEKYRNPAQALQLSKRANELPGGNTAGMLDTLAACYAANGDFDQAISTQVKAMDLAPEIQKEDYKTRLELYQAKKPFLVTVKK